MGDYDSTLAEWNFESLEDLLDSYFADDRYREHIHIGILLDDAHMLTWNQLQRVKEICTM